MGIDPNAYRQMLARQHAKGLSTEKPSDAVEKEADLHADILAECANRQWIVFHGSMAHQAFRTKGEPDFVVLCNNGRTLLVEAKTRNGKLSPDQLAIHAWANKLGHSVKVVRSLSEFLEAANQ